MNQVEHNQLLKRFEEDVEKGTGRSVDEIRDTPICEVERAKKLRQRQYYIFFGLIYQRDIRHLIRHCQSFRENTTLSAFDNRTKEANMLCVAIWILKHRNKTCGCN